MAKLSAITTPSLTYDEGAAAPTPAANEVVVYAKSDGLIYSKDDAGVETLMSSGLASSTTAPVTFVAAGTSATGTGDVTPALPTGHAADDILVLIVQSDNQAASAPAGYTQMGPAAGLGTAAAAGGTRLTMFWKRDGGSEVAPTVTDTGDHTLAVIIALRGCPTSGDPFRNVGATTKTTASTTSTGSAGATPADNCLIVQVFGTALDSASAAFSSPVNASLSSVTEQVDVATADGNGGGIGVITGLLANAGTFVATTATVTSTTDVGLAFYFLPLGYLNKGDHIDRQVFLTPGVSDTWTRPSSAKRVRIVTIGGGASGSAGRNAATAAGGGGGGGGAWNTFEYDASLLAATMTVAVGAGGAATAHVDGTAANAGGQSSVTSGGALVAAANGGSAGTASGSGSGGNGGNGGGSGGASLGNSYGLQPPLGGTGGTTAGAGGIALDFAGGAGAGGGTTQAASAGGGSYRGGGGGGGGRSNTNFGTGGPGGLATAYVGGATASANGTTSGVVEMGGGGGAGGTSASGTGGMGGWPGGGGGGGGSQSGAQGGGKGGDGVVVITTYC